MSSDFFKEGGPHKVKKVGGNNIEMSFSITLDEDGRLARECSNEHCSPGYFKVRPGTGITKNQKAAYCPYCKHKDEPNNFMTKGQHRYVEDILMREATIGISMAIENGLGLGPSRRKKFGQNFELEYKPGRIPHVSQPIEDALRRDIACPHCGLDHAVYGFATWCPDCGKDIFISHVEAEFNVVKSMLNDCDRREKELGARVLRKDIENALEDTVSIFEASLRSLTYRYLINKQTPKEQIDTIFYKKIKNTFQNISTHTCNLIKEITGKNVVKGSDDKDVGFLNEIFQKRHPITHNLGIVDRKYLGKVHSGEIEGRDVHVTKEEVERVISTAFHLITSFHNDLFA